MSRKTLWSFFIDNHKFTLLIVLSIVAFGLLAIVQLPKESDPEVKIPIAIVQTVFPGASVEEVEELVTTPIEDRIRGVDDVEKITSNSSRGVSVITVEFDPDADEKEVIADLKDRVDEVVPDLPGQAEDPRVQQISFSDQPFLILSLAGPFDTAQLRLYADILETEIERIGGVNDVAIVGGRQREIQILIDKAKLDSFGLSINQVTQAISQSNNDIPIGSIQTAGEDFALRFAGRLQSADQIAAVPIGSQSGVPVLVRDIATVADTFSVPASYSFLSARGSQPNPGVTLQVTKDPGGDITRLSRDIQNRAEEIRSEQFPEEVQIEVVQDMAEYISQDLRSLSMNGLATVIIVIVLLVLFIGWKEALMAGFSIPLAFLMTFIGLTIVDLSINFMTLFSLILALGILVDSAIVINEGLSKQRKAGKSPRDAAVDTIREFQYPLASGTLTTVFAFVPMLLTGGIIGEYIKSIPITVTLVLVSSLFVALAIVTTFSATFFAGKEGSVAHEKEPPTAILFTKLKQWYEEQLHRLLERKGSRRKLAVSLILVGIAAYALPATGLLRVELFPSDDLGFFAIDVEKPFGTPLEATRESLLTLTPYLEGDERIKNFVVNVGSSANLDGNGGGSGSHVGHILVNLVDKSERDASSNEIIDEYRDVYADFDEGDLSISQAGSGPPGAAPVEIKLTGDDLDELDQLALQFERLLADIPGTTNVGKSTVETNGQFVFRVDRIRAEQAGTNATQIALALRNAITGSEATEIRADGDDIDVIVKYTLNTTPGEVIADTTITDIQTIEALTISTPQGSIPVSSVVDIQLENSRASISHEDGERVVSVTSNVDGSVTPIDVFATVRERMDGEIEIPAGVAITLGGESEETAESFADMLRAMILAVIMIAALMVLQFKSFRQSILIIITIPLALIGVFPGLLLMNQPISFPGVIGIVALAGIVVNNAIILIDKMNTNRADGMDLESAIVEAGMARVEPIVLTTITTVFGILPLALTQVIWASLGYAIIFGLLFSTVTTLVVIPVLYRRLYRKESSMRKMDGSVV